MPGVVLYAEVGRLAITWGIYRPMIINERPNAAREIVQ